MFKNGRTRRLRVSKAVVVSQTTASSSPYAVTQMRQSIEELIALNCAKNESGDNTKE